MQDHISSNDLSAVLERFNRENPNADSFELARFMFNLGYEACDQGGIDKTLFPQDDPQKPHYEPIRYLDDGTNLEYGNPPEDLSPFEEFHSQQEVEDWLVDHGYDPADFAIVKY